MDESTLTFQQEGDLAPEVATALLRWALALADTKHRLGMRFSEWVNGTPALEAAVAASAMTQDELGHARSYFSMLRNFSDAPEGLGFENDLEARDIYFNPRVLDSPWASWLDLIAVNVLLDRALAIAVAATSNSAFAPLRQRAAKVLQEEAYHRIFGDTWLTRLAARDDRSTSQLQDSLDRYWQTAFAWFGPEDDEVSRMLHRAGILNQTPEEMRARWLQQVAPLLEENGFAAPSSEPDWSLWDPLHRDVQAADG